MPPSTRIIIEVVQNYGGFFGGDTIALTAVGIHDGAEYTLTIDQAALANVAERHRIVAGMLLALDMAGQRVERAELLGAPTRAELREALGAARLADTLAQPEVLSYRCDTCEAWIAGPPDGTRCRLCGAELV